ncbi:MAG TPA: transglutaminase family protein [Ohtaekwangia sp.]|nr:transglutaminase family protein [Ohtaekwangia sp.]
MSKFKIRHITKYRYENTVRDSANQIMLYPLKDAWQETVQHSIMVSGAPAIDIHTDYFGNEVGTFTHAQPHRELSIDSKLIVVTRPRDLPMDDAPLSSQWQELGNLKNDLKFIDFLRQERFETMPEIEMLINQETNKSRSPLQSAQHLSEYIFNSFAYRKGITTVETTLDEIWQLRSGVCQDFAHILLAMLRLLNIPARYVSGYICPNKNGMRGEGATHAWVEAYIPFYGWLGLDPTNNCLVNDTHVRLAVGKNFSDCSPVKGTYRGTSNHTLEVTVSVSYEDGQTSSGDTEIPPGIPGNASESNYQNSFRRYQEMQMQQ